ncbi:sigma-70 family RNA polymerase sigma factor [Stutzerimonas kirkiae]|uniref:RNA polymerase subunit sigma n=1 Tax=Stutzerimonas kirkiae TaxID=2211392 RepID=A0A4V2KDF8_9GAMM|nr:sigma-70 family RNA polymerase sigma factor [Stutzerimonas kirkiae]TBU99197.1 RNA polymerase subunit sigma [Stutzerimonas kirkiae]TBV06343.1 RNA polymerase subunit sigma [Stutzerimonas kirkiae]TBV07525.1 RNA polymerase subunit sigma [Stutzerimonas kirkiae]TBV15766.1 RNA polymerase subunit sigma [Stutzerimonas kirkiae]
MGSDPLGQLYREHNGWLNRWLYLRLGCRSQAADVAQDAFLRILRQQRREGSLPPLQEPRAYLATIGRRLVYDYFRRQSLEQAYLDSLALLPEAHAISAEEQLAMREALFELDALLDSLKPVVREVFLLSQLEGLTYAQIAGRKGISERTVKRYMASAFEACILFVD